MLKPTKKQHIICECGTKIDTTNIPQIVICDSCGKSYGKKPPVLLFMGIQREHFPVGTIII